MKLVFKVERVRGTAITTRVVKAEAPAELRPDGTVQARIGGIDFEWPNGKPEEGDEITITLLPAPPQQRQF